VKRSTHVATTIDGYIGGHPPEIRARLRAMRATIRQHAPDAEERISYRMPTFYLGGNLVHFAAFDRHVGFYPGPTGIAAFEKALAGYKSAKGSVQFPHDEPLPLGLVADIVRFRVAEQATRHATKKRTHLARAAPHNGSHMPTKTTLDLVDGARCKVVAGTHAGKAGVVRDIHTSKGGHVTITVVQDDGVRFKTLAKNVVVTN
jgi:uncharacterized protein YdhG (YjbR/CyaY superfamily)